MLTVSPRIAEYYQARRTVVGPFWEIDFMLFDQILEGQRTRGVRGDLLEIGALYGKSAIVLGLHAGSDSVVIVDIFETSGLDDANKDENELSYPGLNRSEFERNYGTWVKTKPRIVQEYSDRVREHVADRALRFAHIDGGHLFNVVASDIANTRPLMNADGVVVLDDFRALHTPGVAAATWAAIVNDGLTPFCVSEQKLYASWNAATADTVRRELIESAKAAGDELNAGIQEVAGHEVLVIENPPGRDIRTKVGTWVPPAMRRKNRAYVGTPL